MKSPMRRFTSCRSARGIWAVTLLAALTWLPSAAAQDGLQEELIEILTDQAAAWNRGDLEGFMQAYWNSEQLSFSSGGQTTRGWDATLDRYRQRYQEGIGMGSLSFADLEVTALGDSAALVLGRWNLKVEALSLGGNFSLVWRKIDGHWKIIHDHTSSDEASDSDE